ncbi:MAG: DUF2189 domain-containing protein [Rhodobacteraceae bacterium]|nr:DUF2189 domain-containing protein [Paracoccaceae bacterium]
MTETTAAPPNASGTSSGAVIRTVTADDVKAALAAGFADFKAAPMFGLFFSAIYMLGGMSLYFGLLSAGQLVWFIFIAAGFPIIAPFAAVGLYEVSRRRETGEPLHWGPVLGALRGRGDGQLPVMAVLVLIVFGFWVILARGIFAIFLGRSGIGTETLGILLSLDGLAMLVVGTLIGGALAFALFAVTLVSLPMLLDREVDFVTAIITSLSVVRENLQPMLYWAVLIVGLLVIGMIPLFIGLLVVLPVLGHATWHIYRRTVSFP